MFPWLCTLARYGPAISAPNAFLRPLLICNIFIHPTSIHIRNLWKAFDLDSLGPPFQNSESHQTCPAWTNTDCIEPYVTRNGKDLAAVIPVELQASSSSTVGIQVLSPSVGSRFCGMPTAGCRRQLSQSLTVINLFQRQNSLDMCAICIDRDGERSDV